MKEVPGALNPRRRVSPLKREYLRSVEVINILCVFWWLGSNDSVSFWPPLDGAAFCTPSRCVTPQRSSQFNRQRPEYLVGVGTGHGRTGKGPQDSHGGAVRGDEDETRGESQKYSLEIRIQQTPDLCRDHRWACYEGQPCGSLQQVSHAPVSASHTLLTTHPNPIWSDQQCSSGADQSPTRSKLVKL